MLLGTTTQLPDGPRVRLRLPHGTDRARLQDLHRRLGQPDDLALTRVLRVHPGKLVAIVATVWSGGTDVIAAFGRADCDGDGTPELLLADEDLAPGVGRLVRDALAEHVTGVPRVA